MNAPVLSHLLTLENHDVAPDGAGGFVQDWRVLGELWGEIKPRSGRRTRGETGPMSASRVQITVRACPIGHPARPVAGQRFRHGNRRFRIDAVNDLEPAGVYVVCDAIEELAA